MRIVIPVLSLETGGTRFIYQLANELVDKGHSVEIVLPEKAAVAWPLRAQITRIKELTPDTIPPADFLLPNFYPTVFPAWESKKGRVVRLSLGYEPLWVEDAKALASYLIDAPIISLSQWHRQLILQGTGRNSTVIPGGVDCTVFRPYPKKSLSTGRLTIAYILRSKEHGYTWKGSEDFWEACRQLAQVVPNFDIQVVAPEEANYQAPLPYQIVKATSDSEMARFYAQADIFVSTSYFESFSMPLLEAMACGTAVVTTDNGGNRDYAKNGENCLLVPPSDIKQLTLALAHLLAQEKERKILAQNGLHFAQSWTWRHSADKLEALLYQLART
ncbi:glycosyltransferase family 4 protein [Desulfosporosinus sp. OT]|uniref:glycosyltransferase family 4 protein n=1 Tax=Desulfosporosinus sp. OT TaxID=913865 RepID=UPI000223A21D|nr:glycosyltransferase family 4 protein [Desulfosporosinus sp. OT]EGW35870.1 glycosyl transferases group 1 family protein [Desulfosporosinus sp. OT]